MADGPPSVVFEGADCVVWGGDEGERRTGVRDAAEEEGENREERKIGRGDCAVFASFSISLLLEKVKFKN